MNAPQVVVLGWEILDPAPRPTGKPKRLMPRFTIKSAAEDALVEARRDGYPDAYLHEIVGLDDAGAL